MSRGNLILLGALVLAVGLWLLGRNWATDKPSAASARLFPEFNREGADRIEISGGVTGTTWAIARPENSAWSLVSAGDYPVKRAEVDRFLDGVASLRKDNPVGTSADLRSRTQTDEKDGRLVRVLEDGKPTAEFYVGKNPKQGYSEFFVRKKDDDTIYRTHTVLTKDREQTSDDPGVPGAPGFDWHSYTEDLSRKWIDQEIWDLGGAEAQEIRLTRKGLYDATIAKQAQDKWELTEGGNEPVPADADVADGILSVIRRLSLYEVLGSYDDVREEYGLEEPDITLLMTLRKKVAKPAPKEGEEKEGEEKDGEPKEEYKTFHRVVEVGKKVSRPRYDSYSDETKSDDYYAIHVGPAKDMENPAEASRAGYVFLVREYTVSQLRKELSDLKAKAKEEKGPGEGEEKGAKPDGEKPGEVEPPDGKPADTKPADETKPGDEKETPKGDGGAEKPKDEGGSEKPKDDKGCGCGKGCGDGCGCDEGCGCGCG